MVVAAQVESRDREKQQGFAVGLGRRRERKGVIKVCLEWVRAGATY